MARLFLDFFGVERSPLRLPWRVRKAEVERVVLNALANESGFAGAFGNYWCHRLAAASRSTRSLESAGGCGSSSSAAGHRVLLRQRAVRRQRQPIEVVVE